MTTPPFSPQLKALLVHPGVQDIVFDGTSPLRVRTVDGRYLPATQLMPAPEDTATSDPEGTG